MGDRSAINNEKMLSDLRPLFLEWLDKYPLDEIAGTFIGTGLAFGIEAGIPKQRILDHVSKVYR